MSLTCATVRLKREPEEEEAEVAQLGEIIMLIARTSAVDVRLTGGRMSRISDEEVEVADRRDRSPIFGNDISDNFPVFFVSAEGSKNE